MANSAVIKGNYRYSLTRSWGPLRWYKPILWIMLNPSTADAEEDDATIRRVIGFSKSWGFNRVEVVNLFAFRATNPRELAHQKDPVGPENARYIDEALDGVYDAIVAWGNLGIMCPARMRFDGYSCLGTTKAGEPRHPLRLRHDTPREVWSPR